MKIAKEIRKLIKGENKLIDVWYYIQGTIRYKIYYIPKSDDSFFMRVHIREQIDWRIIVMNGECYKQGSCIKCGCMTTALQMCDKPCEGWCYPSMMNKENWQRFKKGQPIEEGNGLCWFLDRHNDMYNLLDISSQYTKKIKSNVQRP